MAHSSQEIFLSTPDVDEASLAERQSLLNDACSLFIELGGFLPDMFTIKKIHQTGYTEKDFLELAKPFYMMHNRVELTRLFESTPKNDLGKLLERMEFLNTKEGTRFISDAFTVVSEKNKEMAKEEVALAHKLLASAAATRLAHKNILDQIDDLVCRKLELETISSQMDQDLKRKLGPLYDYQEPSTRELRLEAYTLYEADCRSRNLYAYPIHHEKGFETAIKKFGADAKNLHLLSYLNDPIRRESIQKHLMDIEYFAAEIKNKCGDGTDSKRKRAVTNVSGEDPKRGPEKDSDEPPAKRATSGNGNGNETT